MKDYYDEPTRSPRLRRAIYELGVAGLARALGISVRSVRDWYDLPARRVDATAKALNLQHPDEMNHWPPPGAS